MALRLRDAEPPTPVLPEVPAPRPAAAGAPRRRPFRDNSRLILLGILLLVGALAALLTIANRSATYSPDFLVEVVLYALSVADVTMLAALVFVLARNVIKLIVERRRALPFARFRAKLVAMLLGMTLIPSVLVLIVGSEVIRTSADRWFNAPMDEVLSSANRIASDYYRDRQKLVTDHAQRIARMLPAELAGASVPPSRVRDVIAPEVTLERLQMVAVYRVQRGAEGPLQVVPVIDVASPDLRAGAPVRGSDGRTVGVVVATGLLSGDLAERSRRMTRAYEDYMQLRVLKQPLTGAYLSFFLMLTLMIMVGATWIGLYLAKRITRPVQMLSAAAREIGAGHLDRRRDPKTADEFGSLVEAFNSMAGELAASRQKLEQSTYDLQRKHLEVEGRRRYIETVLERIATGVISVDAAGLVTTINASAARLLGLDPYATGRPAHDVLARRDLAPLLDLLHKVLRGRAEPPAQEIALMRDDREVHLAVVASAVHGESGTEEGAVLVFDDVTPLIRSQKVAAWREVARRLAHEIKNPLTPIQLSAERLRRKLSDVDPKLQDLVQECTSTIIGEVESLKGLVDEFSQFARMPAPRAVPTDFHAFLNETLSLYDGLFANVEFCKQYDPAVAQVRVDPEQMKRVMINLIDNAIEAMGRQGTIVIETARDVSNSLVRIVVADTGPGISPAERDKLFLPYYSTKGRGSGLGLAIVRRIVAEHGGSIDVTDNAPTGTRFIIELPA